MKLSKYNFFIESNELDDEVIAYNALSNSLALMKKTKYEKYIDCEVNNTPIDDADFIDNLKRGSFIIEDNVNELDLLRYTMYRDRFDNSSLALTIAPTMDCDFRCVYCYEKGKNDQKRMNLSIQNSIIDFIKIQKDTIKQLNIIWYGGEPLLAIDIIKNLSNQIIDLCNINNIAYGSAIITNGYGLTREVCQSLIDCNISSVQITVDGPSNIHDKRRVLVDGQPTYYKILDNIKACKDIIPQTALRINVDKNNKEYLTQLLDDLKEKDILDVVFPYLGHVRNTNECYKDDTCLSSFEYSNLDFDFDLMLENYGVERSSTKYMPKRVTAYCGADSITSHTIDPNGDIYRCWSDIGDTSKKVANIIDKNAMINSNLTDYVLFDATIKEKCKDCKVLPLCMGGCPIKTQKQNCSSAKFMLDKHLSQVCKNILAERSKNV